MQTLLMSIGFGILIILIFKYFSKNKDTPKKNTINLKEVLRSEEQMQIDDLIEREKQQNKNFFEKKTQMLIQSKTGISLGMYLGIALISMSLIFGCMYIVFKNPIIALIVSISGFKIPEIFVNMKREQRISQFNQYLIKALRRMGSSLNAGSSLEQAIEDVVNSRSIPEVVRIEFEQVLKDINYGKKLEKAFYDLYERTGSEDVKFMTLSIEVQRQVGGNMAETFDTISKTISNRFLLESEVKSTLAQSKMSANILSVIPFLIFGGLLVLNPTHFDIMRASIKGNILIGIFIGMMVFGTVLVRKISTIKY